VGIAPYKPPAKTENAGGYLGLYFFDFNRLKALKDGYNRNKEKWLRKVKIPNDTVRERWKWGFTSRRTHNKI
jgi:hypothetical protein